MKVGPMNTFDGFIVSYKDENGLQLHLKVDHAEPLSGITTSFIS